MVIISDYYKEGIGMKKFALIGVGGYVAPRHLAAIKKTKNDLIAALDPCDSVGIIDSYFPRASFFTEFERFDRHLEKLKRNNQSIDYVSICSPNYLHDAHIRFALRIGANVICEKPVVLNPWNLEALQEIEKEADKSVSVILQLRLHPNIVKLKEDIENSPKDKIFDIDLTYITSRGKWYLSSWKGNIEKSGGISTNIGVHFFDMLIYIYGNVKSNILHVSEPTKMAGYMELDRARVRWFLSFDYNDLLFVENTNLQTYRSIVIDDKEIEFSNGFTDLYIKSYENILDGNGFSLEDAKKSIEIVSEIRKMKSIGLKGDYHPLLKKINYAF